MGKETCNKCCAMRDRLCLKCHKYNCEHCRHCDSCAKKCTKCNPTNKCCNKHHGNKCCKFTIETGDSMTGDAASSLTLKCGDKMRFWSSGRTMIDSQPGSVLLQMEPENLLGNDGDAPTVLPEGPTDPSKVVLYIDQVSGDIYKWEPSPAGETGAGETGTRDLERSGSPDPCDGNTWNRLNLISPPICAILDNKDIGVNSKTFKILNTTVTLTSWIRIDNVIVGFHFISVGGSVAYRVKSGKCFFDGTESPFILPVDHRKKIQEVTFCLRDLSVLNVKEATKTCTMVDLNLNPSIIAPIVYNPFGGDYSSGQITATLAVSNQVIFDGITLTSADNGARILVKDQLDASQNGIWTITINGTNLILDRALDFNNPSNVNPSTFVFVQEGDLCADTGWVLISNDPISVGGTGGTDLLFTQFAGPGTIIAGDGIEKSGNVVSASLKDNGGLAIEYGKIAVDLTHTSITGQLDAEKIANGSVSNINFQYLSGTSSKVVGESDINTLTNKIINDSTNIVGATELRTNATSVVINNANPPTPGQVLRATSATSAEWQTAIGPTGPNGDNGPTGPQGPQGEAGPLSATCYYYRYQEILIDQCPTSGHIHLNDEVSEQATVLSIHGLDLHGDSIVNFIRSIIYDPDASSIQGHVKISHRDSPTIFILYAISSGSVINGSPGLIGPASCFDINISYLSGDVGQLFVEDKELVICFAKTGQKGDPGAAGSTLLSGLDDVFIDNAQVGQVLKLSSNGQWTNAEVVSSAYKNTSDQFTQIIPTLGSNNVNTGANSAILVGSNNQLKWNNSSIVSGKNFNLLGWDHLTDIMVGWRAIMRDVPQRSSAVIAHTDLPLGHLWRLIGDDVIRIVTCDGVHIDYKHVYEMGDIGIPTTPVGPVVGPLSDTGSVPSTLTNQGNVVTTNVTHTAGLGQALSFSGLPNDYIADLNNVLLPGVDDNFGFEAFVRTNTVNGDAIVFYLGNPSVDGFGLMRIGNQWAIRIGGVTDIMSFSGSAIVSTWVHIGMIRNAGFWKLYINYVEVNSPNTSIPITPSTQTLLGGDGINQFEGIIDRVRVFCFVEGTFSIDDFDKTETTEPFEGIYTINKLAPTSLGARNFNSFTDLSNALVTTPVSGPITVNVLNGPYNEKVIFTTGINMNSVNTVTINGNGQRLLCSTTTYDNPSVLRFNGAKWFRINNLVFTTMISFNTWLQYGWLLHFYNGNGNCEDITVTNCTFLNYYDNNSFYNIPIIANSSISTHNATGHEYKRIVIDNCEIIGGYYGVYLVGNNSNNMIGNVIKNTIIRDSYIESVICNNNYNMSLIRNNIYTQQRTNLSTFFGIYLTACNSIFVDSNKIHDSHYTNTNINLIAFGVYMISTVNVKITNNLIYNLKNSGGLYGIFNASSTNSGILIYNNSIIIDSPNASNSVTACIYNQSGGSQNNTNFIKNNILYINRGGGASKDLLYCSQTMPTANINYNQYYGYFRVTVVFTFNSFTGFRNNGYETNGVFGDPFMDSNFVPRSSTGNDKADPSVNVTTDITGATRNLLTPDIGHIEYIPDACVPPNVIINSVSNTTITISLVTSNSIIGETFDVRIQGTDSSDVTITNISSPYIFTGLNNAVTYSISARSDCGVDGISFWSNPITVNLPLYDLVRTTGRSLEVLTAPQTLIGTSVDDAGSALANIGFNFNFYGTTYTQFSVIPDGMVRLGSTPIVTEWTPSISSTTNLPKIFPLWLDLSTGTGYVNYQTLGISPNRKLVIEWHLTNPRTVTGPANIMFQCVLYETSNDIEFIYGYALNSGLSNTLIGIKNTDNRFTSLNAATQSDTSGLFNTTVPPQGTSYKFV